VEVYILDSLYRRVDIIDKFESLIWTERFSAIGDFELILHSTPTNRVRFAPGVNLGMNETYRVMTVETVEDSTSEDGLKTLTVKGRSLEKILDERLARDNLSNLTAEPKWVITDDPCAIARKIYHDICALGQLHAGDIITPVIEGSTIFPANNVPEPSETVTYEIEPMSVYTAIKNIADQYTFGFRLIRNLDAGQLYFDVYTGSDRTSQQTILPAVIFSEELDNLQNTKSLTSNALYRNVAYVISPIGNSVVYPLNVDPTVASFQRRVLFVKADDITDVDTGINATKRVQRGIEELAKNRNLFAFDGEINQNSQYKYGIDYQLGDLVELRDADGGANNMQVTEQIFVSDSQGDRSYPTLALNFYIGIGTWLAWDFSNKTWADCGATEYWADQP
jgi:hypothetical protein